MRIQLDITREDILAYYRRVLAEDGRWDGAWKQFRWRRAYWIAAALGASALWLWSVSEVAGVGRVSIDSTRFWLGMLALYLWWGAGGSLKWDRERFIEHNVRNSADGPEARYSQGPHEIEMSSERLVFRGPHHTLDMAWSAVFRILDEPSHIFFQRRDSAGLIVPKRCLRDAGEARAFLAEARGHHARAGADVGSRLGVFLADRDVACPSCRYNLRGTATGACPECAADLSPLLVRLGGSF